MYSFIHHPHHHLGQRARRLGRDHLRFDDWLVRRNRAISSDALAHNVGPQARPAVGHRRHCTDHLNRRHRQPLPERIRPQVGVVPSLVVLRQQQLARHLARQVDACRSPEAKRLQVAVEHSRPHLRAQPGRTYVERMDENIGHGLFTVRLAGGICHHDPAHLDPSLVIIGRLWRDEPLIERGGHSQDLHHGTGLILLAHSRILKRKWIQAVGIVVLPRIIVGQTRERQDTKGAGVHHDNRPPLRLKLLH